MISIDDIREINIELSSHCNARCPLCVRNFHGFPHNSGYEETDLTLAQLKDIVPESVVSQLDHVMVNGDFGDMLMNPETPEILAWFREHGRKDSARSGLKIDVFTNGGARGRDFWQALGSLDLDINFCIDGLEDTHHLYRQNTLYETVIRNAGYYIAAGGRAHWCMTEFDHNRHQIDQARERSKALGFKKFNLRNHGRNWGPVYNQNGQKVFELKKDTGTTYPDQITEEWINQHGARKLPAVPHDEVECKALHSWSPVSMYIASDSNIDPCCFIGNFSKPGTTHVEDVHVLKDGATIDTLEKGIHWFNQIIDTFNTPDQLTACNTYCTKKSWFQ